MRNLRRALVSAVVAALAVIGAASPAQAATNIAWGSFPQVSAEDRISVTTTPNVVSSSKIRVCLETAANVTWWKAIRFRGWNDQVLSERFTQDADHGPNCMTGNIPDIKQLELWKAKFLGHPTHMYTLTANRLWKKDRALVLFSWVQDT